MVIIDNKFLFMGGIDLCFGRFEYPHYPLCEPEAGKTYFHGQDYSNPRIYDFENVADWERCLVDKSTQPRMPWRDIAIRLQGPVINGMKKHFLHMWNFNNIQIDDKEGDLKIKKDLIEDPDIKVVETKTQNMKKENLHLQDAFKNMLKLNKPEARESGEGKPEVGTMINIQKKKFKIKKPKQLTQNAVPLSDLTHELEEADETQEPEQRNLIANEDL